MVYMQVLQHAVLLHRGASDGPKGKRGMKIYTEECMVWSGMGERVRHEFFDVDSERASLCFIITSTSCRKQREHCTPRVVIISASHVYVVSYLSLHSVGIVLDNIRIIAMSHDVTIATSKLRDHQQKITSHRHQAIVVAIV